MKTPYRQSLRKAFWCHFGTIFYRVRFIVFKSDSFEFEFVTLVIQFLFIGDTILEIK